VLLLRLVGHLYYLFTSMMHGQRHIKFTLKLTLKQLRHVSVQSPSSSGSALLVLAKATVVKIANYTKYIGVW
jgi:hypothetical protein